MLQKVSVFRHFENSAANRLGMPLPKGTLRVYKAEKSGSKRSSERNSIAHTPRDERVRVKAGEAFDVVADRIQMSWSSLGSCSAESAWSIEVRNHKDTDVSVEVRKPASGEWQIMKSSHPPPSKATIRLSLDVPVPKRGKTLLTCTLRVWWC